MAASTRFISFLTVEKKEADTRSASTTRGRESEAGRVLQLVADVREDRLDAAARRRHRTHRHERDQRHEQRVLEQVLSFFTTDERTNGIDEFHRILQRASF